MTVTPPADDRLRRNDLASAQAREVAIGQVTFALMIGLCVALHPGFVLKADEGGMSNYGVHVKTVVPYSVALLVPVLLTFDVSRRAVVGSGASRRMVSLLRLYSAVLLLTLVTTFPYTLNVGLKDLHVAVGVAITVYESLASLWIYLTTRALGPVLAVQYGGLVLAALTFFGVLHVLFLSQLVTGVAFAVLLVSGTRRILGERSPSS